MIENKYIQELENKPKSTYEIILYIDDDNITSLLNELINKWPDLRYVLSPLHDKDFKESGEVKKAHKHLFLKFANGVRPSAIFKIIEMLDLPIIYENLKTIKNWNCAVVYTIHANDDSKYQYDYNDIVSNYDFSKDYNNGLKKISSDNTQTKLYNLFNECIANEWTFKQFILKCKSDSSELFMLALRQIKNLKEMYLLLTSSIKGGDFY